MTIAFHHGRKAINQTKSTKEYLHSDRDRSKFNSKYCEMPTFIRLLLCAFRHVQDGSLYGFLHLCKTADLLSVQKGLQSILFFLIKWQQLSIKSAVY